MGRNQCIDALKHLLRWLMELYGPKASTAPTGAVRIIDVPRRDALFPFGSPGHRPGDATARAKPRQSGPGTEHRLSDGLLVNDPGRRYPRNT